ncbi:peptide chain release factor N(5)-glutamine methyltransferase [Pseudoclavibacter helvolus]|uniref:peptide chain release factor N(5)-glutamine methyltransferase n=1 Tax=Pseudoclavibacter helvolus TaxID=255205 RepID=UPI003C774E41
MILHVEAQRKLVREQLKVAGIAAADVEADLLLAGVLGISRGEVQLRSLLGRSMSPQEAGDAADAAKLRARRVPLQHVLGVAPFFDMELAVGPGVFVPRPETESLVTAAVALLAVATPDRRLKGIDVGSGSGAVALGVAREHGGIDITAVEASSAAWPWLRANIDRYGDGAVAPFFGHAERVFRATAPDSLDLVVSNPPYVPAAKRPESREVWRHDPELALYSGADGLDLIRQLATWSAGSLRPGGAVVIEHEDTQGGEIRRVFAAAGFIKAATDQDLTGRDRITSAMLPVPGGGATTQPTIM